MNNTEKPLAAYDGEKPNDNESKEEGNEVQETRIAEILDELEAIPDTEKQVIISALISRQSVFRSPLPPPEIFEGYKKVLPDAPERILTMAENNANARISENKENQRQSSMGQIFAFLLVLAAFASAVTLGLHGHDTVAGIIGGTTIVSILGAFISRNITAPKDTPDKK